MRTERLGISDKEVIQRLRDSRRELLSERDQLQAKVRFLESQLRCRKRELQDEIQMERLRSLERMAKAFVEFVADHKRVR